MYSINLTEEFMAKLAFVTTLAPTRDVRYFLNSVHFVVQGNKVEIDSTDGHILSHTEIEVETSIEKKIELCLDVEVIKGFLTLSKKCKRMESLNTMVLDEEGNGKFVCKDGTEFGFENKGYKYPNVHDVLGSFEGKGNNIPLSLSIVYLERMCDAWNKAMGQVVRKHFDSCMVATETDVSKMNIKYTYTGDELVNTVVLISAK